MSKEISLRQVNVFPEITSLQLHDNFKELVEIMPEHKEMLSVIKESLPEIHRSSSLFFKTQSQFMDNMLTVAHNTPLRNLRQILAQMNSTREAIKEAHFKLKKKEIELRMKQREIDQELKKKKKCDDLKVEMLEVEILEIVANAQSTRGYISGAIRQLTNYTEQYNSIMEQYRLQGFTEADFEREEEKYHIKKAFEQGLCAARTRHDRTIDEGNMIYLTQLGINGAHAQMRVREYLKMEDDLLKDNKAPTNKTYLDFLESMYQEFKGSAEKYAKEKGMATVSQTALIQKGDTRFQALPAPSKVEIVEP